MMKHRIRIETIYDQHGLQIAYGWHCITCGECSVYFASRLGAYWASVWYRRKGVCRGFMGLGTRR